MRGEQLLRVSTFTIIAFASFMTVGSYALAAQATDATQDVATDDANKLVCKAGRAPIGSRLSGPRECHTQAQWDEMARLAHEQLYNTQQKGLSGIQKGVPAGGG